jgi:hypothetical protein
MLREEHMIIKLSNLGNIEAGWFSLICIYALEKYNIDWRQNMKSWVVTNYFWNVWRHISALYIKDQEYRTLSLISFEWCRFGPCCFEHLSGFIPRDLIVYDIRLFIRMTMMVTNWAPLLVGPSWRRWCWEKAMGWEIEFVCWILRPWKLPRKYNILAV